MKYIIELPNLKNCTECPIKQTDYQGTTCKATGKRIDNLAFKRLPEECPLVKYND